MSLTLSTLMGFLILSSQVSAQQTETSGALDYESTQEEDKKLMEMSAMQLGDLAADLELTPLSNSKERSGLLLSSLSKKKPVVVFMGSCTCNLTRDAVPKLNRLYSDFKDRANFAFIYMKEAHPKPEVSVEIDGKNVPLGQPETIEHRAALAKHLMEKTGLRLPVYLDNMKGSARKSFSSYHLAAYIVNTDGDLVLISQYRYDVAAVRAALGKLHNETTKRTGHRRKPTHANVAYGSHQRNVVDFYKVESEHPTPLLVFFHGGGWRRGSKENLSFKLVAPSLEKGISVASANYRLTPQAPHPAQLHDSARVIQFLRSKAAEWNIDPTRIAAVGGSAGGSISLWLAFHDDMADPESDDPIARQSTRLRCAFSYGGQSTNDPRVIRKIIPGRAYNEGALKMLFGLPADWDWDTAEVSDELSAKLIDASPITHLTKDDPPIFAYHNETFNVPGNIHHPNFGSYLKKQMDGLGIECVYEVDSNRTNALTGFLQKHFEKQQRNR